MSRIAIDYTAAYEQGGGIGRYVREITAALTRLDQSTDYRLFVSGATASSLPSLKTSNVRWRSTRLTPRWLARIWHRAQLPIPVETFTGVIDLYHATDFVLPPTLPRTRTLLTVHDLSFVRVPDSAEPSLRRYLQAVVPMSVRKADHILADSQATKNDLMLLYDTPEEKITVLYCGVDRRFASVTDITYEQGVLDRYNLRGVRYLLSVGTLQPRKNYPRIIRAVKELRDQGMDLHYVIAGGKGWLDDEIYSTITDTNMHGRIHLIGFVDDDHLPVLYGAARALITVSLYEGFGLPLLEAMACGTPVISSNLSSLPEVVGDAGLQVDPADVPAIGEAIARLESDPELRKELVNRGLMRAKQFTWERSAKKLHEVYGKLLEG